MANITCDENIDIGESCVTVRSCASTLIRYSTTFREVECPVPGLQDNNITCVSIDHLISEENTCLRLPKSQYYTYGHNSTAIWVKLGCQADFKVCFQKDNNNEVSTSTAPNYSTTEHTPSHTAEAMTSDYHTTEIAVGVSIGLVALAVILFVVIFCWCKRRKQKLKTKHIQVVVNKTPETASPGAYDFIDEESIKPRYFINKDLVSVPLPPSSNLVGFSVDGPPSSSNTRQTPYALYSTPVLETEQHDGPPSSSKTQQSSYALYSTPVLETDPHDNMAFEYDSLSNQKSTVEIITDSPYDVSQDMDVYNKLHEHERKNNVISDYLYDRTNVQS